MNIGSHKLFRLESENPFALKKTPDKPLDLLYPSVEYVKSRPRFCKIGCASDKKSDLTRPSVFVCQRKKLSRRLAVL